MSDDVIEKAVNQLRWLTVERDQGDGNRAIIMFHSDTLRGILREIDAKGLLWTSEREQAAKREAWDEGSSTALDHAIREDDGITLRLDKPNPYEQEVD